MGGASQNSDRDTLIRKAQQERQKRAELRQQNNGATIIQSYARSFLLRQQIKEDQRHQFDELMANKTALTDTILDHVLRRILFFYYYRSNRDGERLVSGLVFITIEADASFYLDIVEPIYHQESSNDSYACDCRTTLEVSHQEVAVSMHTANLRSESFPSTN